MAYKEEYKKQYKSKKEDWNYRKGMSLYKNKNYQEALEYFKKSIENRTTFLSRSIFFVGKIYSIQKRYKEAEEQFKEYIEIDKDRNPHGHLELGRLYASKGRKEEAEEQFKKCLEIDQENKHAHLELGRLYASKGREKEAEEQFKKCLEIDQENKHAHLELGRLYASQKGREEEAEEEFKKYIEIDQDRTPHTHFELGRLYASEGREKEAEEQFKKCLEIDQENKHAHLELGRLYASQKGREEEAEEEFKKYIEIDKDRTLHAHFELGRLYANQNGREEEAEEQFKKCLEIDAEDKYAKEQLQKLYEKKENSKICVEQLEENEEDYLTLIRAKLYVGTISNSDIPEILDAIKDVEKWQACLIEIAIYEKLGQKRNAINVIKQMKEEGIQIKGLGAIEERLKSKKTQLFDLDKWDQIIGWNVGRTKQYDEEERKKEDENKQQEINGSKESQIIETSVTVQELPQEEIKEEPVVSKFVTSKDIVYNSSIPPKRKTNNNVKKSQKETEETDSKSTRNTIETNLSESLKETISKINCYYYVQMQPQSNNKRDPKEYQDLTRQIVATRKDKRKFKQLQELMEKMLKNDYKEASRQEKYIKKYDKLQSILECDNANKRAQMELMLVLINEGYREVAKREFPEADYEFIDKIIKGYYAKTIKPEVAKKEIDEYCI